jgi:hypothetical protein
VEEVGEVGGGFVVGGKAGDGMALGKEEGEDGFLGGDACSGGTGRHGDNVGASLVRGDGHRGQGKEGKEADRWPSHTANGRLSFIYMTLQCDQQHQRLRFKTDPFTPAPLFRVAPPGHAGSEEAN